MSKKEDRMHSNRRLEVLTVLTPIVCTMMMQAALWAQCSDCGDVNHDGLVNIIDSSIVNQAAQGLITLTLGEEMCGDFNGDGLITETDSEEIADFVIGLPAEPSCRWLMIVHQVCDATLRFAPQAYTTLLQRVVALEIPFVAAAQMPASMDAVRALIDLRFAMPITPTEQSKVVTFLESDLGGVWFLAGGIDVPSSRGSDLEDLLTDLGLPGVAISGANPPVAPVSQVVNGPGLVLSALSTSNGTWSIAEPPIASPWLVHLRETTNPWRVTGLVLNRDALPGGNAPALVTFLGNRCVGSSTGAPGDCPDRSAQIDAILTFILTIPVP